MPIDKLNRSQNKTKRRVSGKTIVGAGLIERQERKKSMERENSQNTIYACLKMSNNKIIKRDKNV